MHKYFENESKVERALILILIIDDSDFLAKIIQRSTLVYLLPNKLAGPNKRAGWKRGQN